MPEERANYEAPPTKAEINTQLERLIGDFYPGRSPADFQEWADEVRRQIGHYPYGVLRRAVNLILTNDDITKLPRATTVRLFMDEAQRAIKAEQREQPALPPPAYHYAKPSPEVMEFHLCRGAAIQRNRRSGEVGEPLYQDIQVIMEERRAQGIPLGRVNFKTMDIKWKDPEVVLRARQIADGHGA